MAASAAKRRDKGGRRMSPKSIAIRRWLGMMFIIIPLSFVIATLAARQFAPVLEGPHVDNTFWVSLQNVVGFYIGYAFLAGTLICCLHTIVLRRFEISEVSSTILLGGLLGFLALVPQALVFGVEYWLVNFVTGALVGLAYGLLVTLSPFR